MKINKLTENKIQIIFNTNDLTNKNIDVHTMMTKAVESSGFFLEILDKAEKEVGFNTNGCKLLIEATTSEDFCIFTITKYLEASGVNSPQKHFGSSPAFLDSNKRVIVKRKSFNLNSESIVYNFKDFDTFCEFCNYLNSIKLSTRAVAKNVSLYLFNNTYFLILDNINHNCKNLKKILSLISEFANLTSSSNTTFSKIKEFGSPIIKTNAFNIGIKYFS